MCVILFGVHHSPPPPQQPTDHDKSFEKPFVLAGFIMAMLFLVGYSLYMILNTRFQSKKIQAARDRHMIRNVCVCVCVCVCVVEVVSLW